MEAGAAAVDHEVDPVGGRREGHGAEAGPGVVEGVCLDGPLVLPADRGADGLLQEGGTPGWATSRFQVSAQRNPVGSTRARAVTRSRFEVAIGAGPTEVATTTANGSAVVMVRSFRSAGSPPGQPASPWVWGVSMTSRPRVGSQPGTVVRLAGE